MQHDSSNKVRISRAVAGPVVGNTTTLTLTISNTGLDDAFITYPLIDYEKGENFVDPNRVFVQVLEGQLIFSLKLWDVPDSVDVYRPEIPMLLKVPSGQEVNLAFELGPGLVIDYPYLEDSEDLSDLKEPTEFREFYLDIGVVHWDTGLMDDVRPFRQDGVLKGLEIFESDFSTIITRQLLMRSRVVLSDPITVLPHARTGNTEP